MLETANPSLKIQNITLIFQIICYTTALLMIIVCYWRVYSTIRRQVRVGGQILKNERWTSHRSTHKTQQVNSISLNVHEPFLANTYYGSAVGTNCEQSSFSTRQPDTTKQMKRGDGHSSDERDLASEPSTSKTIRYPKPPSVAVSVMKAVMQRSVTRMLLITSVVFILMWLPYWIYVSLRLVQLKGGDIGEDVITMMYHFAIFVPFNSVVNPVIYGMANKRFRKDCTEFFRKVRH